MRATDGSVHGHGRAGGSGYAGFLVRVLGRGSAADPVFGDEIRALWLPVASARVGGSVSRVFTGHAEKVVQARDIHGGLTVS